MRGWIIVACLAICTGCSAAEERIEVFPVQGKVMVAGQPAGGAMVIFHPMVKSSEFPSALPRATTDADGTFKLSTFDTADGAPEGNYVATVVWQTRLSEDAEELTPDRLAGRYGDPRNSQLKVSVRPESNQLEPFELN